MPIDPKTGREYPYTEEGIQQYEEDTSGAQSPPFTMKGFPVHAGTSPAKQKIDPTAKPWGDQYKKETYKKLLQKPTVRKTMDQVSTKGSMPKNFNVKGSSGVPVGQDFEKYAKNVHEQKFDKFQSQKQKAKKFVKKLGKFIGGKALGVAGMMGAGTLSATAGNVGKKPEGEQIRDLLTKHNLKGKR